MVTFIFIILYTLKKRIVREYLQKQNTDDSLNGDIFLQNKSALY